MYWQRSEIVMAAVRSGLDFATAERVADCLPSPGLVSSPQGRALPRAGDGVAAISSGHVQEDADQVNGHVFHGFPADSVN
jgi:hypothetical protein